MNAKDKLKYLMGAKARRMWVLGIKNWHLYYGPEDAEEIEKWSEIEAEGVWEAICREVIYHEGRGLNSWTCPWCIFQSYCRFWSGCKTCGYGKRHGCCEDLKNGCRSDFCRIVHGIRRKWDVYTEDKFWDEVCFPNEWYRKVVERMENER